MSQIQILNEHLIILMNIRIEITFGIFFLWHINLWELFNAKTIPVDQQWYNLAYSWVIRGFMPFSSVLV